MKASKSASENSGRHYLKSTLITAILMIFLIVSGPVSAILVQITGIDSSVAKNELIDFNVTIDIEDAAEHLPLMHANLLFNTSDGTYDDMCKIGTDKSSNCTYITVSDILYEASLEYGYGYGYGYDYGYSADYSSGYGYGYGYNSSTGTITFKLRLNTTDLPVGSASLKAEVVSGTSANNHIFSSKFTDFSIATSAGDDTGDDDSGSSSSSSSTSGAAPPASGTDDEQTDEEQAEVIVDEIVAADVLEQLSEEVKEDVISLIEGIVDFVEDSVESIDVITESEQIKSTLAEGLSGIMEGQLDFSFDDIALVTMVKLEEEQMAMEELSPAVKAQIEEELKQTLNNDDLTLIKQADVRKTVTVVQMKTKDGETKTILKLEYKTYMGDHVINIPKTVATTSDDLIGSFIVLNRDPVLLFRNTDTISFSVAAESEDIETLSNAADDVAIFESVDSGVAQPQPELIHETTDIIEPETKSSRWKYVFVLLLIVVAIAGYYNREKIIDKINEIKLKREAGQNKTNQNNLPGISNIESY